MSKKKKKKQADTGTQSSTQLCPPLNRSSRQLAAPRLFRRLRLGQAGVDVLHHAVAGDDNRRAGLRGQKARAVLRGATQARCRANLRFWLAGWVWDSSLASFSHADISPCRTTRPRKYSVSGDKSISSVHTTVPCCTWARWKSAASCNGANAGYSRKPRMSKRRHSPVANWASRAWFGKAFTAITSGVTGVFLVNPQTRRARLRRGR